jgi:rare lipoprotein A
MNIKHRLQKLAICLITCSIFFGCAAKANSASSQKTEEGIIRWISKSFQGRPTASGEPHDYNALIAAHRTFRFGTYVHIRNLENDKTAIVRINDRTPSDNENLLLVSWRTAKTLDMLDTGMAEVEIHPIKIQTGVASWYGGKFHGRKTANGEIYNMNKMSAAHKTLPFNTRVRVVDLETERSVIVRINDRGPYVKGRIIDLSRQAASELGMLVKGVTKVRVEILPPK